MDSSESDVESTTPVSSVGRAPDRNLAVAGSTPVPTPQAAKLANAKSVRVSPRVADRLFGRPREGYFTSARWLSPAARTEAMQCVDTAFAHVASDDCGRVLSRRKQLLAPVARGSDQTTLRSRLLKQ